MAHPLVFFAAHRGLRQGDPMSPALFTILSDLLSRLLLRAGAEGKIKGVKISRTSPAITHILYADDTVVYCRPDIANATEIKHILQIYCSSTGQEISWEKSAIHFSVNVNWDDRRNICQTLGIRECTHKGKYLGHPFCKYNKKSEVFKEAMDEMANKLSGWKSKPLSYVGRQTLIKAVVSAVPSFVMHTFHLPKVITSRMDSLIRDFFCGFSNNHTRHWYPKAWSAICLPKDDGRLGLRRMGDKNLALIMKLAWSIVKQPSKTWVQLIK